jgi:uncharacterized membrane protein YdbT with pleckstrin-like domain
MLKSLRTQLLEWLRVPPEPSPPTGAPGSLRVFRAAPNFWRLQMVLWGFRQLSTVVGLIFAITLLRSGLAERLFSMFPPIRSYESVILVLEILGLLGFLAQLPVSFLIARLDYELRWYLVTDRSLRLRRGIWTVEELTMTFANIQELSIQQNPWQRFLGIADLKVRSAGGGASLKEGQTGEETHVAYFHGVDNAPEIRDLIQEHLRRQRDTGLGDPEAVETLPELSFNDSSAAVAAAREVLSEVRALRAR